MKGLQGERVRQAFQALDRTGTGYVTGGDFARIIKEIASHKLSDQVVERLPTISQLTQSGRVSYSELRAFVNVVKEIDLIEIIVKHAINRSKDSRISKEDFMDAAGQHTRYGVFTPLEAEIIFHFANNPTEPSSRLRLRDFNQLFDPKWDIVASEESLAKPSVLHEIGKSIYSFGLGGIAGGLGASAVYPIDLVKTRMQNQRSKVVGELLYRNSMDCVRKVYANEGLRGFYRGLPPQLLGVAPEKAIKLTVNDLVRRRATDPETGKIKLIWEFAAGGCAGASQVVNGRCLRLLPRLIVSH
jgi:solute carrier family 25 aspartate/glutamate transporter 12/13